MKTKKSAALALTTVLAMSTFLAACGGNNNAAEQNNTSSETTTNQAAEGTTNAGGVDTSKEVKIKMLLVGGKPADYDQVFGELNKLVKAKINATVEAEFLDWADWNQKYPLKFAANEDFDIAYTANWAFYNDQALKGGFLELTDDMLKTYMPKTWEAMPTVSWGQAKVNGKLFMVPNNNIEVTDKTVLIREDLRKKYNLEPVTSPETYAAYLKAVAANEKGINAFGAKPADGWKWHELDQILLEQQNDWNLVDYNIPLAYKLDDATGKVFNVYDTPEFTSLITYYKDLSDSSAWSRNVVSNKNDVWQDIKAGKTASYAQNLGTVAANLTEARRDGVSFELAIADLTPDKKKISAISTQNGLAIHASSKNVERSLMLIDLLQNDKEIHDLTMYGIAGTHYNAEGDDKFSAGPSAANYTGFSNWGWNSTLNRTDVSYPAEAQSIFDAWVGKVYHFPLETFVFDDSKVKNEVANIGNVMLRYAIPLEYGLVKDLAKGQADLNAQLKSAGIEKVQTELQSQIDAFLAAQK
ncbi:putative aldouronate transport system substrate-binding protein [Paenibacillus phyllosphaerae]|uniref:Putative aldouronate transport system substrate-binding protein n=1 Tax=Paenibacillus phyllosphaerae TaxID=274593 RepID=A0A7W5AW36_9BACL|nr:ABC transporter substrate-binding protein [Paenibacillus phyllosphaerae]MBB3109539.1 putative aldouronate transport system substrate-binding protein [Paenibacillus phyllosphaerae]